MQTVSFNDTDVDNTVDPLRVSGSVVYQNKAPAGEYRTSISATVTPQGDTESATIALTVTRGTSNVT